jgi:hypothetical protein
MSRSAIACHLSNMGVTGMQSTVTAVCGNHQDGDCSPYLNIFRHALMHDAH